MGWGLSARDLDGDERAEVLIGALADAEGKDSPGAADLFVDLSEGRWRSEDAAARFVGESHGSYAGMGVGLGDIDGDTAAGAVYVQTAAHLQAL